MSNSNENLPLHVGSDPEAASAAAPLITEVAGTEDVGSRAAAVVEGSVDITDINTIFEFLNNPDVQNMLSQTTDLPSLGVFDRLQKAGVIGENASIQNLQPKTGEVGNDLLAVQYAIDRDAESKFGGNKKGDLLRLLSDAIGRVRKGWGLPDEFDTTRSGAGCNC